MMIDWCIDKKIHLISDEIYGNSLFPGEEMTSVAELMYRRNPKVERYMGNYIHVVAGFSKDFCMSGLRCGTLFTHNQDLLDAIGALGLFTAVSNQSQWTLTQMLNDEKWTMNFINKNRQRLHECF